jgi:hypothetical protein
MGLIDYCMLTPVLFQTQIFYLIYTSALIGARSSIYLRYIVRSMDAEFVAGKPVNRIIMVFSFSSPAPLRPVYE